MVTNQETVAVVEGPNGKAEVLEVPEPSGHNVEYKVVFKSPAESFEEIYRTMGEAYITAKEKAGVT